MPNHAAKTAPTQTCYYFKKLFVTEPELFLDLINRTFFLYQGKVIANISIRDPKILPESKSR